MQDIAYKQKYLKYKAKYLNIRRGGAPTQIGNWDINKTIELLKTQLIKFNDNINGMTCEELNKNLEILNKNPNTKLYYKIPHRSKIPGAYDKCEIKSAVEKDTKLTITYITNIGEKTIEFKGKILSGKTEVTYPIKIYVDEILGLKFFNLSIN
jgi:hypothetical protein